MSHFISQNLIIFSVSIYFPNKIALYYETGFRFFGSCLFAIM